MAKLKLPRGVMTPERFAKLPGDVRRVLIAKDVIRQLEAKKYEAQTGRYVSININYKKLCKVDMDMDARKALNKGIVDSCVVCARGSMFLSTVRFRDKLSLIDMKQASFHYKDGEFGTGEATNYMNKDFSVTQQSLIECAFEGCSLFGNAPRRVRGKAANFALRINNPKQRLIAICKNIIANNGEFVP